MPTLGGPELVILLVIVLIVFGAGKLRDVGRDLGKGIREFRGAVSEPESTSSKEDQQPTKT